MTNIEALKNLYVANGGDRADVEDMNLSSEVINALAGYIGHDQSEMILVDEEEVVEVAAHLLGGVHGRI